MLTEKEEDGLKVKVLPGPPSSSKEIMRDYPGGGSNVQGSKSMALRTATRREIREQAAQSEEQV